jgi:hypothetical protein
MKFRILLIAFLIPFFAYPQSIPHPTIPQQLDPIVNNQFGQIRQIPLKPPGTTGSVYLNDGWKTASLKLKTGTLSIGELTNVSVKLDLKTNTFELFVDPEIKVLSGSKVESFTWTDDLQTPVSYVNCERFTLDDTKVVGFGRILSRDADGLILLEHSYIEFMQANYNIAMNVGSKDHKYVKKEKLYFVKNNKMVPAGKKSLYEVMADKESAIKKFIKENDVNVRDAGQLAKVVEYYNSI